MAQVDFFITAGDTLPNISAALLDAAGAPVDLTGAAVQFQMAPEGSQVFAVDSPAVIADAPAGGVEYDWQAGDTATPALYLAVFRVTKSDGTQTYPPGEPLRIVVQPGLGSPPPAGSAPPFTVLADVEKETRRSDIDETSLGIAWSVIEGIIGRPLYEITLDVLTARDQYWLKKAICWQAAWVQDNPDVFSAFDASNINQTGQSMQLGPDGLLVAPMARRALKWVTWMKSRSVKIQQPAQWNRLLNPTVADDLGHPWRGM